MDAKQYAINQAMDHGRNQKRKSQDTLRQMKMETQCSKIYGTHQKHFFRGKFIVIQAYLRK